MIQPIRTPYDGINFRSKTEARWAVFLKTLNVVFEYEPFKVDHYVPDFYLKTWRAWLEVKPPFDKARSEGLLKWANFKATVQSPALIIFGDPWPGEYQMLVSINNEIVAANFCECKTCGAIGYVSDVYTPVFFTQGHNCSVGVGLFLPNLSAAYKAARTERF